MFVCNVDVSVRCVPPLDFRYRAVRGGRISADCFGGGNPHPVTTWTRIKTEESYPQTNSSFSIELDEVSSELFVCTARNPHGIERCYVGAHFESYDRLYEVILQYLGTDDPYSFSEVTYNWMECDLYFESLEFVARESEIMLSLLIVYEGGTANESTVLKYLQMFYEFMCVVDIKSGDFAVFSPYFGDNIYQSGLIISELVPRVFTEEGEKYTELFTYLFTSLLIVESNLNISYGERDRQRLTEFAVNAGIYTAPTTLTTPPTVPISEVIDNITTLIQSVGNTSGIDGDTLTDISNQFESIVGKIDDTAAQDNTLTEKVFGLVGDILTALGTADVLPSSPTLPSSLLATISSLEMFIDSKIQGLTPMLEPLLTLEEGIIHVSILRVNTTGITQPVFIPDNISAETPVAAIPVSVLKQVAAEGNVSSFYVSAVTYDINVFFANEAQTTRFLSLNFHLPHYSNFASSVNITFPHGVGGVTGVECISFSEDGIHTAGVQLVRYSDAAIVCGTNHTTTFAAIVSFNREMDRGEYPAQKIVSFILLAFSFLAISVSLVLFCLSGKAFFHNLPNLVYFNYAIALLFGCGTFLFLLPTAVLNQYYCIAAVFTTQYAWISVFTWSLSISALLVYFFRIQKVQVRNTKPILCYLMLGWGIPLVPCLISLFLTTPDFAGDYISYEPVNDNSNATCFLSSTPPHHTSWGLLGPVFLLLLLNITVLTYLSIYMCCRLNSCGPKGTQVSDTFRVKFRSLYAGFLVMTLILGLPWMFLLVNVICNYFIQVDLLSSVMEWIFLILNAPIGVVFFFAYTIKAKEVRSLFSRNIFTKHSTVSPTSSPSRQPVSLPSSLPRARKRLNLGSGSSSITSETVAACYDNPLYSP